MVVTRKTPVFRVDSLQLKYFFALSLPLLAALFILIAGYFFLESRSRTEIIKINSRGHIDSFSDLFTRALTEAAADLVMLAENHMISPFLADPWGPARTELAQDLSALVTAKGGIDQARIISLEGKELLRVNLKHGRPYLVVREQLQDKSGRDYVIEALKLGRDQIYISRFDLNIEHGLIEQPYKPMIRFAAALFDDQGVKKGILVLNYLGERFLDLLRVILKTGPGRVMFIDKEGYWLFGPEPEHLWGFMFPNKKDMTFGRFFPQTWKIIAAEKEGQFISKEGLFTFTTVPPIGIKAFRFVPREDRLLETRLAASSRAGHCKVIHHIPKEELAGLVGLSFRRLFFLFGAMALAAVLIAWFTAQVMAARKRVQKELRIKESAIQSSINAIVMTDLAGRITYVNHAALDMFGYEETDEILGRFAAEYFKDPGLGPKILGKIKGASSWLGETVVSRKDGAEITVRIAASPVKDENGQPYRLMASMVDISEQKKAEAMLMFQARHDALTGLYNRRYLMERLETEMGAAKRHGFPLAVCLCDLDHFKAVNDTYGHRTGDEVLAGFGRLIAAEIRAQDTAGRYGGEEFCIVFPYISASAAKISLERIRTLWEKTAFEVEDGRNFWVTASFGLAELEGPDMSPNDLLEKADQALYRAKESGRNRVVGP